MARHSLLDRLLRLSWHERLLLVEATTFLAVASIAIAVVPFRRIAAFASRRANRPAAPAHVDAHKLSWAVNACANRVPWRAVCFQRGLALHHMLQRRGRPSLLHYGVATKGKEGLEAHVWVTCDGVDIIGGEEARRFTCLATFPGSKT